MEYKDFIVIITSIITIVLGVGNIVFLIINRNKTPFSNIAPFHLITTLTGNSTHFSKYFF